MTRRTFYFLISLLLVLSFAGCALLPSDPVDSDPDPDSGSDKSVVVSTDPVSDDPETDSDLPTDSETDSASSTEESQPHDILKTPMADLTADEQDQLANYLFEKYVPCSYGIFTDAKDLSSASVWSSVEALNRVIDGDESEASRKLENVLKKVAIYYPETDFDPTKVRVYDANTQTFAASPAENAEYVMLSYEIKGEQITIHYEDQPDENDPNAEPEQYATTLKHSPTEGYFAFVSSVKTGAVG